jgi:hypothetical protein
MMIFYSFCLVMVALCAGFLAAAKVASKPEHDSHKDVSASGVKIKPWASIAEISGTAKPESEEEALKEAA